MPTTRAGDPQPRVPSLPRHRHPQPVPAPEPVAGPRSRCAHTQPSRSPPPAVGPSTSPYGAVARCLLGGTACRGSAEAIACSTPPGGVGTRVSCRRDVGIGAGSPSRAAGGGDGQLVGGWGGVLVGLAPPGGGEPPA